MKDNKRQQILRRILLILGIVAAFLIGNWLPFNLPGGIILFVVAIAIGIFIGSSLASENGFKFWKKNDKPDDESKK